MADGNITKDDSLRARWRPTTSSRCWSSTATATARRRSTRSSAATHDHFWDPLDRRLHRLRRAVRHGERGAAARGDDRGRCRPTTASEMLADPKDRIRFINAQTLRCFSSILHGEQGALNLSASLCHVLYDQGAQEYAANQTREEARHVTAFAKYIKARWGRPVAVQPGAAEPADRDHLLARGLQEDHRHADAGRGPGHGRLRHLLPEAQRPARPQADAAGDDRRGLPPQVRQDLGRPHRAEPDRGRAHHHRGLGGALLPDPAVQPRRPRPSSATSTRSSAWTPTG